MLIAGSAIIAGLGMVLAPAAHADAGSYSISINGVAASNEAGPITCAHDFGTGQIGSITVGNPANSNSTSAMARFINGALREVDITVPGTPTMGPNTGYVEYSWDTANYDVPPNGNASMAQQGKTYKMTGKIGEHGELPLKPFELDVTCP